VSQLGGKRTKGEGCAHIAGHILRSSPHFILAACSQLWLMPIMLTLILGGSKCAVKENAEALVVAAKEIGLEVNAAKTK